MFDDRRKRDFSTLAEAYVPNAPANFIRASPVAEANFSEVDPRWRFALPSCQDPERKRHFDLRLDPIITGCE